MEREILGIKKKTFDGKGKYGEFERKACDILIIENNVRKNISCYMDTINMANYISEYANCLKRERFNIKLKNFQNTIFKRLRNNLIALPFYAGTLLLYLYAPIFSEFVAFILEGTGLIGFTGIAAFVNSNILYLTDKEATKIKKINAQLTECSSLSAEAEKEIANSKDFELARLRIDEQAIARKKMLREQKNAELLSELRKKARAKIEANGIGTYVQEQDYENSESMTKK